MRTRGLRLVRRLRPAPGWWLVPRPCTSAVSVCLCPADPTEAKNGHVSPRAGGALSQHFPAASDTSTVLVHLLRVYRVCVVRRSATEEAVAENFAEPPKDEQVYRCVSQCPCLPSAPTGRTLHAFERYILTVLVLASDP